MGVDRVARPPPRAVGPSEERKHPMRKLLSALVVTALALSQAAHAQDRPKPIRALLVLGGCCHDYAKQKDILAKGLQERANVEVTIAFDPDKTTNHTNPVFEKDDWAKDFDVVIHDECSADVTDQATVDRIL